MAFIHDYANLAENISNDAKNYDRAYSYFISKRYYVFSHYFKNFFQILKLIDDAELTDIQKIKYVEILKSQLSQHELTFIFYDSIYPIGKKIQKSLIEKFHLFTELNDQFIVTELKVQYLQSAYFR
ncbi:putative phage abortive infection protein [Chryseobacterium luquanense]|uniref:putative phage abortive infection protein n=1 Tax=Chryseobacterium luquanense TaxID=2983766 RepID=UPI0035CAEA12